MTTFLRNFRIGQGKARQPAPVPQVTVDTVVEHLRKTATIGTLDLAPNDPLLAYFRSTPSVVEIERLHLDSPALTALRQSGARLIVPLVAQGEVIGLLNLGPRLSEQEYSTDDRALLTNLATQAGPAVRVAQLVRQQQIEAQSRERMEAELRVARLIQQTLLPKKVPQLGGYDIAAYYQPARAVGGDFYDFVALPDGRLGLVVGDVTDKGVPAALVMATTRAIVRGAIQRFESPGQVLESANELLCPDIPRNMFVTCLYAILDPATGHLRYANAGHDLPYRRHGAGAVELRATGMPLGLMPGMTYEVKETTLEHGDMVVFYSDGLVEAHNVKRDMFSFGRLKDLVGGFAGGGHGLIEMLLSQLAAFTGADWEQEDDVTLVTLQREAGPAATVESAAQDWQPLATFMWPSEPGNERLAMAQVAEVVKDLGLEPTRLERLKTAVSEATMNAMEHGNKYRSDAPVDFEVLRSAKAVAVRITDHGGGQPIPEAHTPDLEAKLAGLQSPRGWGLFLIEKMVDAVNTASDGHHHTVELVMHLEGESDGH